MPKAHQDTNGLVPEMKNPFMVEPGDVPMSLAGNGFVTRTVQVGGANKQELIAQLAQARVELNEAARALFASDLFTTSPTRHPVTAVELAVRQLGFSDRPAMPEVREKALAHGLLPPPLELGPHLRLQYLDQPEGCWGLPVTQHRAPPGSLTVASAPLAEDDEVPKGFYLRRIKGTLWLRGYWTTAESRWELDDHLVFCRP
jgi:hypothetical protein